MSWKNWDDERSGRIALINGSWAEATKYVTHVRHTGQVQEDVAGHCARDGDLSHVLPKESNGLRAQTKEGKPGPKPCLGRMYGA